MPSILRRRKKRSKKDKKTNLKSVPSLEDELYAESIYYPILSPPRVSPVDILKRPLSFNEPIAESVDYTPTTLIEDDVVSDILKELTEGGFSSLLKVAPRTKPRVLHVEELAIKQFRAAKDA